MQAGDEERATTFLEQQARYYTASELALELGWATSRARVVLEALVRKRIVESDPEMFNQPEPIYTYRRQ